MLERFDDRARNLLLLAKEEARLLDHNFIGTEHLLLGLLRADEGVAVQVFRSLGITLEAVRAEVKASIGATSVPHEDSPPFTPRTKRVLELSLREALQAGSTSIGTEHVLLGLLREGEGVAATVLFGHTGSLGNLRRQVEAALAGDLSLAGLDAGRSPRRIARCARRHCSPGTRWRRCSPARSAPRPAPAGPR